MCKGLNDNHTPVLLLKEGFAVLKYPYGNILHNRSANIHLSYEAPEPRWFGERAQAKMQLQFNQ